MEMRVLILAPNVFPNVSGNAMTVERWRRSMAGKGLHVETISSQACSPSAFADSLRRCSPDIIHVHHAFRAGSLLLDPVASATSKGLTVVASPGGTDINIDLDLPEKRKAVERVFGMAGVIIAQSAETVDRLRRQMPDLASRIVRVPKSSCWFGHEPCDLRAITGCTPQSILFFLPAGIRPVKGNLECLRAMERVHAARPQVRFAAAGPAIDAEYADHFGREVKRLSKFAFWIDAISPAAMRSAYESSDVVLNSSFSEGLSNSLLEAVASGRPILASDIPGNWWPVRGEYGDAHGGLLYDISDPGDMVAKAIQLIDDETLRIGLGRASRLRGSYLPSPEEEASGLIAAYELALTRIIHEGS